MNGSRTKRDLTGHDWIKELEKASGLKYDVNQTFGATVLAIDCSSSMDGAKIEKAKKGALDYMKSASSRGYLVGIVKFSSDAEVILDPLKMMRAYEILIAKITAAGSTNMTDGLLLSANLLKKAIGKKIICLVTDGMPDNKDATILAAKQVKQSGIEIITIGTDDADRAFLAELASSQEFSCKVSSDKLDEVIASTARLLPTRK